MARRDGKSRKEKRKEALVEGVGELFGENLEPLGQLIEQVGQQILQIKI
ncbi:MAG: hypothetical protein NC911_08960 [Candidatus Omnitrophica bacterium]|nr:hypothetical protein [Candidatus Omnitrophota bacterium]